MGKDARKYTDQTLKKLYGLSNNQCAFPGCTKTLVNEKNAKDSNISHIEGANEGSERYNVAMTDVERADYSNLILLCIQHHDETNDVEKFTVSVLKEMKQRHESKSLQQTLKNNPSMLKNAINAIASINLENSQNPESLEVFNPEVKIIYNSIKRNVALIQEYKVYYEKLNSLYDELEMQGSIKKEKLLWNIHHIYLNIKGKYIMDSDNSLEIMRQNSDNIIDDIFDELYTKMEGSDFWDEDVIKGISLIMVDAFMRCKILEEPEENDSK